MSTQSDIFRCDGPGLFDHFRKPVRTRLSQADLKVSASRDQKTQRESVAINALGLCSPRCRAIAVVLCHFRGLCGPDDSAIHGGAHASVPGSSSNRWPV